MNEQTHGLLIVSYPYPPPPQEAFICETRLTLF